MERSFGFTCHGAGRAESRTRAKKLLRGHDIKEELGWQGIVVMARGWVSLSEEAPLAYKDVVDVVRVSENAGLSRNVARLRPLGVIKGKRRLATRSGAACVCSTGLD
jgi:tRNA-splicing ligase RtcB